MDKIITEEELKDALLVGPADPDRTFFDDNFKDITPSLSDNPTDEERWNIADATRFIVYPNVPTRRMEICIKQGRQQIGSVYQDAGDGDIYPCEEGGEPYSEEIRETLVQKGAAFDGSMDDPASIVGFVREIPSAEFVCDVADESEEDDM